MGTQSQVNGLSSYQEMVPAPVKRYWTSGELQRIFRLTNRQLQHWDETGLIVPAKMRHKRMYSGQKALEIGITKYLLKSFKWRKGFPILKRLQAMKGTCRYLLITESGGIHWSDTQGYLLQDLQRQSEKGLRCLLIDRDQLRERLNS